MKKYQVGLIIGLYLFFLVLWSIPITNLPFGDVDASGHFALSDYQVQNDSVMNNNLPLYLNYSYGFANNGKPWYPPQFHLMGASFEALNIGRIEPLFLYYLFGGTLIIITTFFLMNELFGFWPAFYSAALLGVSVRDYTTYVWGLWPEKISFALVPVILYCAYKTEKKYLPVLGVLLATQFLLHPQGAIHSVTFLILFTIFVWIKERKFPYDWKWLGMSVTIFSVLVLPFIAGPMAFGSNVMSGEYKDSFRIQEVSSLLNWYPEKIPYAPEMGDFKFVYGRAWTLVLSFGVIGLMWCLIYREKKHLMLLAMLLGIYILMHLNVVGITGRVHRSLNAESHIIYLLCVMGIWSFFSKKFTMPSTAIFITGLATFLLVAPGVYYEYQFLHSAKDDFSRINQFQFDAATWIKDNTPIDSHMRYVGTLVYKDRKWIQALSMRPGIFDDQTFTGEQSEVPLNKTTHFFFDYSQGPLTGEGVIDFIKHLNFLITNFNLTTKYYNNGLVEIYDARN